MMIIDAYLTNKMSYELKNVKRISAVKTPKRKKKPKTMLSKRANFRRKV